jgi:hypothetical protein
VEKPYDHFGIALFLLLTQNAPRNRPQFLRRPPQLRASW